MSYLGAVIKRELKQMFARPLYIFSSVVIMLISMFFFLTVMKSGSPQNMPIAVVDLDHSSMSRRLVHEINATQSVKVVAVTATYEDARKLMQKGEVYGFLVVPEDFYARIGSQRRPTMHFYVNYAYTVGASTSYKQMLTMVNLASGAAHREVLRLKGLPDRQVMNIIQPIVLEGHLIGNPYANYPVYLLTTILPGILGIIITMLTIFSIGYELKMSTSLKWMHTAGDNYVIAIIGKMIPYTVLFVALGVSCNIILYEFMHFPVAGSHWMLALNMLFYVLSMQCLAFTFIGLLPTLRDAISVGALYSMMSFSLSGFTYPKMGMLPFVQALTNIFPLRHYYVNYVFEALMDAPLECMLPQFGIFMIFMFLPLTIHKRLKGAMINLNFPKK